MAEYIPTGNENITSLLQHLERVDEIAVDTEGSGLNMRNGVDYAMGICLATEKYKTYVPFRHKEGNIDWRYLDSLLAVLKHKTLDWHNLKFDYQAFATLGVDPLTAFQGPQYCSLLIAMLVNEELPSKELDWLAKVFLKDQKEGGDIFHKMGEIYGYANLPVEVTGPYGAHDAELTFRLRPLLWRKLMAQGLDAVYWNTELPFNKLLYKMEKAGVGTNQAFASERADFGSARLDTIRKRLHFNPASTNDLQSVLLDELGLPVLAHTDSCDKCKKGLPLTSHTWKASFKKDVMEEYDEILQASNNPTARMIAEYRGWQKAVSSLYLPVMEKVGPDGRIRTSFKQHGTVTGRTSASDPNLQQIPRESTKAWNGNAKSCFTSGYEGFSLIGWDYSQLELRLAAAYGSEQVLLTEFGKDGADPFNVLAPLIFGTLTPETRHDTKTFTYANLYGAGLRKIAAQLGRPVPEVEELYANYRAGIPGIIEVSQAVAGLMEKNGYVKYWDGRRRHMRDTNKSYKAWNSLIQGGGAQLVKNAMLRCDEFCDDDCQIVLTVHDEITFIIKTEAIPHYEPLIVEAMTDWPLFNVKFAVEGKVWGAKAA